jgi:hypothetical protein
MEREVRLALELVTTNEAASSLRSMPAFGRLTLARVRLFTDFVAREIQSIVAS